ncbi:MAG: transcriptional repressor [Bacilli bacterium]|nr:transcriptional repressor [Bacilli bacterium]
MTYNTKQKDIILDKISKLEKDFTIKDIHNLLGSDVGLTTIYRLVNKLEEDGCITKVGNDNTAIYHYTGKCEKENHFYLKCNKCGMLYHVDCDYADKLSKHILEEHGFIISKEHIIINGECKKCTKGVRV